MRMRHARLLLALLLTLPLLAQTPPIIGTQPVTLRASGDLLAQFRAAGSPWVGYAVPAIAGEHISCYSHGWKETCGTCSLTDDGFTMNHEETDGPHSAAGNVVIFYRLTDGKIDRVRLFSADCTLDTGSARSAWIEGVDPKRSVALLASLSDQTGDVGKRALDALALHEEPAATDALERVLRAGDRSPELRSHAAFWLGTARGRRGYEAVRSVATNQSEPPRLREKLVFALMQSHEPQKTDDVIALAKSDPDKRVRSQALFWLGQAAGKKAAGAVRDAVDNDPDAEVKNKAVFALAQMPDDQSIPLLVDLMKNNRNPQVRKKAAFWLGQKNDPRALAAIEDFLRR
jgi:HEAT repeat protein